MSRLRGFLVATVVAGVASMAFAGSSIHRVVLIPLDDRPATGQFAQMIGDLAGVQVDTPPIDLLGHFLQPGRPEGINDWLEKNLQNYDAVIVNTDMVAYGGLIASRTDRSTYAQAINRLREFWRIRKEHPGLRVYGFSTITRLSPTATNESKPWRADMARYAELAEKFHESPDPATKASLAHLKKLIPAGEIDRYYAVRDRNHRVQEELLRMTQMGVFDYFVLGQDDATAVGPHVPETKRLKQMVANLGTGRKVLFAEGIDQLGNVLLSRALLDGDGWTPKIRVVYADQAGRQKVAFYESDTVDNSLKDQILGSGADFAKPGETFDYSLYVNTPDPRGYALDAFLQSMKSEVDQGFPVAVADVNLGPGGVADPRVYDALTADGRSSRILAYAGWNTAGNTMGTTIPAANVYMLARKKGTDPLEREVALRAFILHRLVNDFEYHRFVRPEAYAMIDRMPHASREETYGSEFQKVDDLVKADLGERLEKRFKEQLLGTKFFAGNQQYEVMGLKDVSIGLPWPRAYEVRVTFKIDAEPVSVVRTDIDLSGIPILPLGPSSKGG